MTRIRANPPYGWTPRAALGGMWRWRWRLAAGAAVIAVLATFGLTMVLGPKVKVETAARRDIVQTVVAVGHVESRFRVDIGAQLTGVVASVPVEEGQAVKEGQLLILLDDKDLHAVVDQAEGALSSAQSRFRQIQESTLPTAQEALSQAEANLLNAQKTFDRTSKLQSEHFATTSQLDTDQRDLDVAKTRVRAARLVVAINQPGGTEYQFAQNEVARAAANLRSAQARLSYARILAPRDGTLIFRDVERGDLVQPGRILMNLSPAGEIQLVVQIDEKNLGLIALANKALASAEAYPDKSFPAEVVYVSPAVNLQRGSMEVKLRVAPADAPAYLREDMTVSVDIEVARKQNAVIVPLRFVRGLEGAAPWVLKVDGGRARRQPVKIGLRGSREIEIAEGLSPGDRVVGPDAAVADGQRLRAVAHE